MDVKKKTFILGHMSNHCVNKDTCFGLKLAANALLLSEVQSLCFIDKNKKADNNRQNYGVLFNAWSKYMIAYRAVRNR